MANVGETWTVAPMFEQSAASRKITLRRPFRYDEVGTRRFAVEGTPADCAMTALVHLLGFKPDLVVSGINNGPNLGENVYYSGTVAAAAEGPKYGIPAIAMSVNQRVDVLVIVVQCNGGSCGCSDAKSSHEGFAAMVSGANGDAFRVKDRADIVGMSGVHGEREGSGTCGGIAHQFNAGAGVQPIRRVFDELGFVVVDNVPPNRLDIVKTCGEADSAGDMGSARFESGWRFFVGGLFEGNMGNHVPAPLIWPHGIQSRTASIETANSGRHEHFVSRKYKKIAVQRLYIELHVLDRLGGVNQCGDAFSFRCLDYRFDGIYGANRVGNMDNRGELSPRPHHANVGINIQVAIVEDRGHFQHGSLPLPEKLPRNDIGVVLHMGDENLVAGLDLRFHKRVGDKVDGFGGSPSKNDFRFVAGVQVAGELGAGIFVGLSGFGTQQVDPTMDVGVFVGIVLSDGVDHRLRFLGGGGVVEIDERFSIHLAFENGKIVASPFQGVRDLWWRRSISHRIASVAGGKDNQSERFVSI